MKVIYTKASVERKPEYRQQTLILQEGENRFARKTAVGETAKEHLRDYGRNYRRLTEGAAAAGRVTAVACRENEDGSVDFPFCTEPVLSELLAGKTAEDYIRAMADLKNALTETYGAAPFERTEAFTAFFGSEEAFAGEEALGVTNADLNFDNVFCRETGKDGRLQYTVIDYEWILPFPVPVSYLLYRAFMLDPAFNRFSAEEQERIFGHFGIREALIPAFREMEAAFLNHISPEEERLDYYARVETPMTRTQHLFASLIRLPEDNRIIQEANQQLNENNRQLLEDNQELNGKNRKLNEDNRKLNEDNRKLATDLDREIRTALELSGELGRTQKQLSEQLDKYDFYARKLWFRFFRKLGRAKIRFKKTLFGKVGALTILLFKQGPKTATWKARDHIERYQAEKNFVKKEFESVDREREETVDFPQTICFSILVPLYNTPRKFLIEMIQSVRDQTYPNWELCLADGSDDEHAYVGDVCREMAGEDKRIQYKKLEKNLGISGNTNACIEMSSGDYIALFDHDDVLHPSALFENIRAICKQGADFIYSDEVVFLSPDKTNLIATHFKPDFAPDNLLSNNYICHFTVFKKDLLAQAGTFRDECNGSQDHDIILRLTGCAKRIVHIPKVLYYWRSHPTSVASDISTKTYAVEAGRFAVRDYLSSKKKIEADVVSTEAYPTMYHVRYPIIGHPRIAIITDLTDEERPKEKAEAILAGIAAHTGYSAVRINMIAHQAFAFENPTQFSVSWIETKEKKRPVRLNQVAKAAEAEYLVFLHKDLTSLNTNWLEEMLMLAQQEHIGAVGARILFDDRTLRHGGLILGLGQNRVVGRSHFGIPHDNTGYFGQLAIVEDMTALSDECFMIRKTRFMDAGGFSEQYQETMFDVDLCLKLRGKGYYMAYTPFAELQGGDSGRYSLDYGTECGTYAKDCGRLKERWGKMLEKPDPFYNLNLSLDYPDYRIKNP